MASSPSKIAENPVSKHKPASRKPNKQARRAAQPSARTAVIVLGMHRSGTSALTGVLARVGCDLPKTEMPTNDSNAKGFYESHEVYRVNNALLASTGSSWQDWQPLSPNWARSSRAEEFKDAIAQVFADEFGTSRFFALKDPRICRLFPFWEPVVREAGCEIVVIHTHRNPLEVAQSLQNRKKLPLTTGMMVWLRYVLDAEAASRNHPRSFTSFGRLMQNWKREIDQIETDLGLVFPRRSLHSATEIDDFLTSDLKHFNQDNEDIEAGIMVSDWVRTVYQILEKWAAHGEDHPDRKVLDEINTVFSRSAENFGPMIQLMQNDVSPAIQEELANKDNGARKAEARIKALNQQIEDLKAAFETAEADQTLQTGDRDAQADQIAALEKVIQHQARELGTHQTEKAQLIHQTQAHQEELAKMVQMTASLVAQQNSMRETLNEWKTLHAERVGILKEDLASSRETASAAKTALRTHEAAQDELTRRLKVLEAELAASHEQADALATTQSALRQRQLECEQAHETIRALKADIEQMTAEQGTQARIPAETVAVLESVLAERSREVASFERKNAELGIQIQKQYQEIANLSSMAAKVTKERDELRAEKDQMHLDNTRDLKKQMQQINIQKAEIKATSNSLHEAKVARDYFQNTLAALQSSTSWRITGPLRRLTRLFRR